MSRVGQSFPGYYQTAIAIYMASDTVPVFVDIHARHDRFVTSTHGHVIAIHTR